MMSCSRSQSWLGALASPMTLAPVRRASWTASEPTPPAAADTTIVSPGWGATAWTHAYAAIPATNSEPATSHGTDSGLAVS